MPSQNNDKLKRVLNKLSNLDSGVADVFKSVDQELADVAEKLKKSVELKTVEEANTQFKKLQKALADILPVIEVLKKELEERDKKNLIFLQEKLYSLTSALAASQSTSSSEIKTKSAEIAALRKDIMVLADRKIEFPDFTPQINSLDRKFSDLITTMGGKIIDKSKIDNLASDIETLKNELERVERLPRGGGNAQRKISVNSSVMSIRYNDLNFTQGGNIGWSVSDDNVNKRVNIQASLLAGGGGGSGTPGGSDTQVQYNSSNTFAGDPAFTWAGSILTVGQQGSVKGALRLTGASTGFVQLQSGSVAGNWNLTLPVNTGGAGQYLLTDGAGITQWASVTAAGGSGITRSINVITTNTTGGTTGSTDYVYFAGAGMNFTLPTAIGNTNLYTLKVTANTSVLVSTSAGQTIDDSNTALLDRQYTALSFLSNNSVWGVV